MEVRERRERFQAAYHDGARNDRLQGPQRWMGSRISPDGALEADLDTLRQRSNELVKSSTIGGAIDGLVDHAIGKGFTPQAKIAEQPGISKEAADGFNTQLEAVYQRWSPQCDLTARKSLWELSRLAYRVWKSQGEAFTIMWAKRRKGQPIPLVLEVIDCDRVETPSHKISDPYCRLGVQYAADGEILGYWVRRTHPYDPKTLDFNYDFIESDRMLHVFESWFPGQSRGYPWLTRAISRLRDADDLDEAGIVAAQVEACNAAFVKTSDPAPKANAAGTSYDSSNRRLQEMIPGAINYLDSSCEEVLFSEPTKSNIVGTLYEWNYRRIASGVNWPYEFLMRDWRGMSFAGGRLILNGAKITCQCDQQLMTLAWFVDIWNRMVDEAVMFDVVDFNKSRYAARPWVYQAHKWTPPKWSYAITPGEEVRANKEAVRENFKTLEEVIAEDGGDLEERLEQRRREVEMQNVDKTVPPDIQQMIAQAVAAGRNAQQAETANAA
jgi:lambda family phage portal protein